MKFSFFPIKPNPALSARVSQVVKQSQGINSPAQATAPVRQQFSPINPDPTEVQPMSNARFRSFCERYIVERCRDWKEGEIDERAWAAILEAKSIYNKVKEVGRTLTNDN